MNKLVVTATEVATSSKFDNLQSYVQDIDTHVCDVHVALIDYQADHKILHDEYNAITNKELCNIKQDIRKLKAALLWVCGALLCAGIGIIALSIQLIS